MQVELVVLISITSTIVGVVIGLITLNRNKGKDIKKDAETQAQVNVKLNHIIKGVDDVKLDIKSTDRQINQLTEQLIRVDESTKSAHKRIDKIENKI